MGNFYHYYNYFLTCGHLIGVALRISAHQFISAQKFIILISTNIDNADRPLALLLSMMMMMII